MGATCAVCLQPIVARQDVRIAGSEVLHRACAASGRETAFWRQARQVSALKADLATSEATRARLARDHSTAVAHLDDARRICDDVATDNQRLHDELSAQKLVIEDLRRQLAISQARVAKEAQVAKEATSSSDNLQDDRDPTEVRFSLLDMD